MVEDYWAPHVTVAAVIPRADGRYLMVEERDADGGLVINQPAGHLEPDESLLEAVVRETREETGHLFEPQALTGLYQWRSPSGESFLRVAFLGQAEAIQPPPPLDRGILRALWLSPAELRDPELRLRSPMVWRCVADHLAGREQPLSLLVSA